MREGPLAMSKVLRFARFGSSARARWLPTGFLFLALLAACGKKLPVAAPPPVAAPEALRFTLRASSQVNLFDGEAHALWFCLYQLSNPGPFQDTLKEPNGPNRLLDCEPFDPCVKAVTREYIQPREREKLVLDREEGARHVGVIAGYFRRKKGEFATVIEVPVAARRTGFFWLKKVRYLDILDATIYFGPESLEVR